MRSTHMKSSEFEVARMAFQRAAERERLRNRFDFLRRFPSLQEKLESITRRNRDRERCKELGETLSHDS